MTSISSFPCKSMREMNAFRKALSSAIYIYCFMKYLPINILRPLVNIEADDTTVYRYISINLDDQSLVDSSLIIELNS